MNPDTLRQIVAEMRLADRYIPLTYWADRIEAEIATMPEPVAMSHAEYHKAYSDTFDKWVYDDWTHWTCDKDAAWQAWMYLHDEGLTVAPPAPAAVPDGYVLVPLEPTHKMIEAGAQRLVSWEDGCVWPDSWDSLQVLAARNEAERVWRSMWLAAAPRNEQGGE